MPRFENGYIKFYRRAFFEDIGSNGCCLAIWTALLNLANWQESKITWNGQQRVVPPGSMIVGIRELAKRLNFSKDTVARWLDYLKRTNRIETESATRGTFITICNWNAYQGPSDAGATALDTPAGHDAGQPLGHQPDLTKEVKKGRKNKSPLQEYPKEFLELYDRYPNPKGKKAGFEVYSSTISSDELRARLGRAIDAYARECREDGTERRWIKHFGTFMNNWTDYEPKTPKPGRLRGDLKTELPKEDNHGT